NEVYTTTNTTVGVGIAEVQSLTVSGSSGTFTLTFNGQTTTALPFNATAAQVQAALSALSSIGGVGGAVTVNQSSTFYTVTFGGAMVGVNQPQLVASGSGGVTVTVNTLVDGDGAALELDGKHALDNGGIAGGLNIWYERLVLNGPGNATFGDGTVSVLSNDNMWRGPVTLNTSAVIQTLPSTRLTVFGIIADQAPSHLIHDYELNNSFADALGGPDVIPNGGSLTPSTYVFGPNEGLTLSNALP